MPKPERRRRGLRHKLLLAVATFTVTGLGAEFAVRLLMPAGRLLSPTAIDTFAARAEVERTMIRPDDELGHAPVLGGEWYDEFGLLRTFPPRSPRGERSDAPRWLFLGDSVTRRASLVTPLQAFARIEGHAAEILNAGVESWNPVQEVAGYFRSQRVLAADHVVLSLHNNDLTESTVMCLRDGVPTLCNPGSFVAVDPAWYRTSILYQLWVHGRHTDRLRPEHWLFRADDVERALAQLRDEVLGRGARLTILGLPIFAAERDWQPHERAARDRERAILQRLGLPCVDLQPACEELAAAGLPVREIATDPFHPNAACSALLAFAAADTVFGPSRVQVTVESHVIARANAPKLSLEAGPTAAGRTFTVVDLGDGAGPKATGQTVATGTLDANGRAVVTVPAPTAPPGTLLWHGVSVAMDGGSRSGRPVPLVVAH
jgi:hypothetical protein